MKRIQIFLLPICAGLSLGSFAQKLIIHDPNVTVRQVQGFHAISVSDAIDLYLSQSENEAVAVSAVDDKWRDRIRTEVEDGVLKIYIDQRGWVWNGGDQRLRAYVSFKVLDRLLAAGACDVYVDGIITGAELNLDLSGASDFKGVVKLNKLTVRQRGASHARMAGIVMEATTIELSGASDLKGYDLVTDQCEARASGASDLRITVNKELSVYASQKSGIFYKGNAVIKESQISKKSSVTKKE